MYLMSTNLSQKRLVASVIFPSADTSSNKKPPDPDDEGPPWQHEGIAAGVKRPAVGQFGRGYALGKGDLDAHRASPLTHKK